MRDGRAAPRSTGQLLLEIELSAVAGRLLQYSWWELAAASGQLMKGAGSCCRAAVAGQLLQLPASVGVSLKELREAVSPS